MNERKKDTHLLNYNRWVSVIDGKHCRSSECDLKCDHAQRVSWEVEALSKPPSLFR